jgi:hypothetical protein
MKIETIVFLGIAALISYTLLKKSKPIKKKVISPIIDLQEELPENPVYISQNIPSSQPSLRGHLNPYEVHGFGIDIKRNTDDYEMETYLDLPLVGSGKTYSNERLAEIDSENVANAPIVYKYFRFNVQETRDQTSRTSIGALEFYNGSEKVNQPISIWDPHTGERDLYTGPWTNNQTKSLSLFFHSPCPITSYRIKTSNLNPADDPSIWSLEGSMNASYWIILDNKDMDLPINRGKTIEININ